MGKWWVMMIVLLAFGDRDGCERYPVFTHAYGGFTSNSSTLKTRQELGKVLTVQSRIKDLVEEYCLLLSR